MKKNQAIPSVEQSKSSEAVSIVGSNKTSEAVAVEVSLEAEKERTSISEDGCEAKTTPSRLEQAATPLGMEFSLSPYLSLSWAYGGGT